MFAKSDTGFVVKWNTDDSFENLAFTAGSFPNGIALDKQQQSYSNYNLGDKSILFNLTTEESLECLT